jgi:hypothetical protein
MSDTIDLLNTIGQDAALRYASAEDLEQTLEQADASDAFKAAVASGDSSHLSGEFGIKPMQVPQVTQAPGQEDENPDDESESPIRPPAPDRSQPYPGQ